MLLWGCAYHVPTILAQIKRTHQLLHVQNKYNVLFRSWSDKSWTSWNVTLYYIFLEFLEFALDTKCKSCSIVWCVQSKWTFKRGVSFDILALSLNKNVCLPLLLKKVVCHPPLLKIIAWFYILQDMLVCFYGSPDISVSKIIRNCLLCAFVRTKCLSHRFCKINCSSRGEKNKLPPDYQMTRPKAFRWRIGPA